ncbi:MAG TPA: c-type cytochrome, partial [Candidatus Acidoferrum sp.]|nr:c-type cytochrome [Candidatus Acidoferrum sp.]
MNSASNRLKRTLQIAMALALAGIALPGASQQSQTAQKTEKQPPALIHSLSGLDLFQAYCAPCHGLDGRGTGPVAPVLKSKVPDLTLLTRNYHGQFPAPYVRQVITGELAVMGHGSREMPVWGPIFHQVENDMDWGDVRVTNLMSYLMKIQSTTPAKIPSGEELYQQDCAVCHGSDLKGTSGVPEPYRPPPDLTMLTRKHGGTFPTTYVTNVVETGSTIPAHGPTEMPIWGTDFTRDQW